MKTTANIIAIRKVDTQQANLAFSDLMKKTENILNENSRKDNSLYKGMSSSELEQVAENVIKKACTDTPFNPNEIRLVSGQKFPDIVAEKYYGVEVKSTDKNHWISTGSSIVESTRVETVENIYMLFGKLGGTPPEFKCRPYQDVLYDIAVTHSPRYLINMDLKQGESIFSKMQTTYDELRTSPNSIEKVRHYYREKAKKEGKQEMPWWLTNESVDSPMSFNIRLWDSISLEERQYLLSMCLILFPETVNPRINKKKYNQATLWLCSYRQVVNPNIRDAFSAGGQIKYVDGKKLDKPIPKIFKTLVQCSLKIKEILSKPTEEHIRLMNEYNPKLLCNSMYYQNWISQVDSIGVEFKIPIRRWIENQSELSEKLL